MRCRICNEKKLKKIFSLGKQPLANSLLAEGEKAERFPLEWYQCKHCSLIQLGYVVPKEKMFDNYFYIPSVSKDHLADFKRTAEHLNAEIGLKNKDLIVDVGGSDGSFLKCFERMGNKVINVEPAKNIETDVKTYRKYFNLKTASEIRINEGKAKLVTMTNVFAHIDNLKEVVDALDMLLTEDGVFFARFPNVKNLLAENQFDTIYHEHLSYFTYEPLYHLFLNTPFEIFKIEETPVHGGSMMIYVRRRNNVLKDFIGNVKQIKQGLRDYIVAQKKKGKKIIGFGAAAKGTILLNYCNLDGSLIDYVVDDTPYKIGKLIPGVNLKIEPSDILKWDDPDIMLILAWNWKEEIMRKHPGYIYLIPIPRVEVIST